MTTPDTNTKPDALARVDAETALLFDRTDDAQIVARIQGRALKECVYGFRQNGVMIYGLSVDGAEECKREMARMGEVIREDEITLDREDAEYAYFKAYASRWGITLGKEMKLDTTVELKRQPKYITLRNGTQLPDEFWYEKGGSKAMRNAVLNLVSESVKAIIIEKYKDSARVVEQTPAEVDARVAEIHRGMEAKDERDDLVRELRGLWEELKRPKIYVKTLLRDRGLSDVLAEPTASWAGVDQTIIADLVADMRREAGK